MQAPHFNIRFPRRSVMVAIVLGFVCFGAMSVDAGEKKPAPLSLHDFLDNYFESFPVLTFVRITNASTVIQRLQVNKHIIGRLNDKRFTGFRFTVPEWVDGDLEWMYFHLTNEANKRRIVPASWGIVVQPGAERVEGFEDYNWRNMTAFPELRKKYPNSRQVILQSFPRSRLSPGKTYAIYFCYEVPTAVPDIAIALTIKSERGHREFGALPLK